MLVEPGTFALRGRSAYYRSEADRVLALAAATPCGRGRECFEEVAQEYRALAAWYGDEPEPPAELAAGAPEAREADLSTRPMLPKDPQAFVLALDDA